MIDETMKTLTEELISRGTSYDIDFLKRVYADDLKFVRILPDNTVQILSKQDNIDFFQTLKDSGAAPLNTAHTILFADSDGETGTIVLKRRMSQGAQEQDFLFTITKKKPRIAAKPSSRTGAPNTKKNPPNRRSRTAGKSRKAKIT